MIVCDAGPHVSILDTTQFTSMMVVEEVTPAAHHLSDVYDINISIALLGRVGGTILRPGINNPTCVI